MLRERNRGEEDEILPRVQGVNVSVVWRQLRTNEQFMQYFPDHNFRKAPPRVYFWKVVAQLYPNEYQQALTQNRERLRANQRQFGQVHLTEEAMRIFNEFNPQDVELLLRRNNQAIRRPATLMRQTMRRNTRAQLQFLRENNQQNPPPNAEQNQPNQEPQQPFPPQQNIPPPPPANTTNQIFEENLQNNENEGNMSGRRRQRNRNRDQTTLEQHFDNL